jgi:hypothetical protein
MFARSTYCFHLGKGIFNELIFNVRTNKGEIFSYKHT